jgi:hypothetical protein
MESKRILLNVVILTVALCMALVGRARAVGTAFTYQGRLSDANIPAEGFYDFEFELYDQDAGGNQFGNTVTKDEVEVINGYFTVPLDFVTDANVFNGDLRWLAIAVRPGASIDPCDFATLSPRQELTSTPYAIHSGDADTLDSFDSSAFANSEHEHDGVYAFMAHSHDGVYALISHDHDDRYYTQSQLQNTGEAIVHWDNLSNTPAGLGDGDDVGLTVETDPTVAASVKDGVSWAEIASIPADIADGDNDSHLGETQVETYIANDVSTGYLPYDNGTKLITSNVYYDIGSGNVGIGTTSPGTKFHVHEPSSSDVYLSVEASSNAEAGVQLRNSAGGWDVFANNDDGDFGIAHAESDRVLTIKKTNGNVGIGTTDPNATLDVNGDLKVTGAYRGNIGPNNGAPFPRPAYDSGWVSFSQGQGKMFFHNIGGNVENYVVDMQFIHTGAGDIGNIYHGGHMDDGYFRGAYWRSLTSSSIMVARMSDDGYVDQIRIRIWVYN